MLFFDAVVGNNDRHFENWGIIENVKNRSIPCFSPVYDTARGLFWNYSESNIERFNKENKLNKYIKNSFPATGWDGKRNLNHFKLLELVLYNYPQYCNFILTFNFNEALNDINGLLNDEFKEFFSEQRRYIIKRCVAKRIAKIQQIIQ